MPRGKKTNDPAQTQALETSAVPPAQNKTKIDTYLTQVRNLCRARGLQIWNKQSLSDLIYQDLLFLYHVPRLCRDGILTLDIDFIGKGHITEPSFKAMLTLKENDHINAAFVRLWTQLQRSEVKALFVGREFAMFPIEKNAKTQKKYYDLLTDLFAYSASVDLETYDSNAGYTYFKKGLNKGTAKVFGQFYTPPSVQKSVVAQVNLTLTDIVLDPSCGSCSFIQESAKDLIERFKVTPNVAFKNLRGVEVEPNIYTEGIMNMFINFGILPDMEHNIREADAFLTLLDSDTQVDKIVANPPFGADATTFFEHYFITTTVQKGKRQVKTQTINPQVKVQIPYTNTKESAILFFQIIVQKLKDGGKAGVVMNGSIFNDAHSEMIHWFLDACNLTKIIINPSGTFKDQGTNIETYSFIFTKGTPTKTIGIVMLGAENDTVRTLTYDDVKAAGWRIKVKEEEVKAVYSGIYTQKKLGDIIVKTGAGKTNSTSISNSGSVPFYGCTNIVPSGYHDKLDFNDADYFLFAKSGGNAKTPVSPTLGIGKFHYIKGPSAANIAVYQYKMISTETITYTYLNRALQFKLPEIQALAEYNTGNGNIDVVKMLSDIYISIPPLPIQELIVANLDRIFANPTDMTDTLSFTPRAMDLMLKDPTGATLEDAISGLRLKRAYLASSDAVKAQMAAVMRSIAVRGYEQKKLGDLCYFVNGYAFDSDKFIDTGVPVVKITTIKNNKLTFEKACFVPADAKLNKYIVKNGDFVIALSGATVGIIGMNFTGFDCYLNQRVARIDVTSELTTTQYVYLYMVNSNFIETVREISGGSAQPNISTKKIEEMEIPIPPLSIQQEILTMLNEMEAERATLEQMAAKAEQRAKYILDNYLNPLPQSA